MKSIVKLLLSLSIFAFQVLPCSAAQPHNVLFISVDDMNDWVGCLGSNRVPTPNIDGLAARGLLFSNAHAPSPKCAPSRAAILLGKRSSTTGLYSNGHWWRPAFPDLITLPHYFKQNGYFSAGGGKVHHHTDGFNPPDQWDEYLVEDYFKKRGKERRFFTNKMPRHPSNTLDWGPMEVDDLEMGDGYTVNWATEFLARKHDKPFFLAVGFFRPHLPFYAPKKYFDTLPKKECKIPINKAGDLDDIPDGGQKFAAYRREDLRMIEEYDDLQYTVQSYLTSIAHADTLLGILMDAFDKSPYRDNTIIVFWSDHGYTFGEKDHFAKDTLWERSTHVPFIFVAPGFRSPGTKTNTPVDLTCLYPTLISLCGLEVPKGLDGIDITPILKNPHIPWEQPAIMDFLSGNTAVRTKDWRYICYAAGGEELYDHIRDPEEWTNMISTHRELSHSFKKWLPDSYAKEVPTKGAYDFNPSEYSWKLK